MNKHERKWKRQQKQYAVAQAKLQKLEAQWDQQMTSRRGLGGMTEAEFQQNVIDLARTLGWLIHHDGGNMGGHTYGNPGFPDLVLAKQGRIIFLELKSEKGVLSKAQDEWVTHLENVHVVRPSDIDWIAHLLGPNGGTANGWERGPGADA